MRYDHHLNQITCPRRIKLIKLVSEPISKVGSDDPYDYYVEEARRFLMDNINDIFDLEPCPRFVAVSGEKIFYGERQNEVGYRVVMHAKRSGAPPGLILDLEPSTFRF